LLHPGLLVKIFLAVGLVLLIVRCSGEHERSREAAPQPPATPTPSSSSGGTVTSSAADVVRQFGTRMKNVSLLAPREAVASAIRENYASLVTPDLLGQWLAAPESAPGRNVSSPWPDRIDVHSAQPAASGATVVFGEVVEVTSTGEAARRPIRLTLKKSADHWLITRVESPSETGVAEPSVPKLSADQRAAVDVIQAYYAAIAAGRFGEAYALWGENGPPNQTPEKFAAGFRDTASVAVETGAPTRVEGAAGSRYVDVPVVVNATTRAGNRQRFTGTYTLRRTVVDGADANARRWHIYSAKLSETSLDG
jgi:hypothetical protein